MYRVAGPKTVRLDKTGDCLEMNCTDLSDLRGWVQLLGGDATNVVVQFHFSPEPTGEGLFFEATSSDRLTTIGNGSVSASVINCKGFARVRMIVTTATTTVDSIASFRMCSYTEVSQFGFLGRDRGY